MNAVDQEFRKNLLNDERRENQVWKCLAHQNNAFSKFSTGNIETLQIKDIRNHLLKFY